MMHKLYSEYLIRRLDTKKEGSKKGGGGRGGGRYGRGGRSTAMRYPFGPFWGPGQYLLFSPISHQDLASKFSYDQKTSNNYNLKNQEKDVSQKEGFGNCHRAFCVMSA